MKTGLNIFALSNQEVVYFTLLQSYSSLKGSLPDSESDQFSLALGRLRTKLSVNHVFKNYFKMRWWSLWPYAKVKPSGLASHTMALSCRCQGWAVVHIPLIGIQIAETMINIQQALSWVQQVHPSSSSGRNSLSIPCLKMINQSIKPHHLGGGAFHSPAICLWGQLMMGIISKFYF